MNTDVTFGDTKCRLHESYVRDFLRDICCKLLDDPNSLEIETQYSEDKTLFILRLPKSEVGKLIGEGGKLANAIRLVVKSYARKLRCGNVYLTIVDNESFSA